MAEQCIVTADYAVVPERIRSAQASSRVQVLPLTNQSKANRDNGCVIYGAGGLKGREKRLFNNIRKSTHMSSLSISNNDKLNWRKGIEVQFCHQRS